MTELKALLKRNSKLFFKDKGLFFTSLITPVILLVLYISFLGNVFRDTFKTVLGDAISIPSELIESLVGGQIFSSLLSVSAITVAFCSNMLMVQDKVSGAKRDLMMTPVRRETLALGYFGATFLSTLTVCLIACVMCFIYIAAVGWYMSLADVLLILADVFVIALFGTSVSSLVNVFLSSQGHISAVGTIVSSGYGFISGAYMPISQFGEALQRIVYCLPGTYGTALLRTHCLRGALAELSSLGFPPEVITDFKDNMDCDIYLFDTAVPIPMMYLILFLASAVALSLYILALLRHPGERKRRERKQRKRRKKEAKKE